MLHSITLTNQIKHYKVMKKATKHERILRAVIILLALFGLAVNVCRAQSLERHGNNFRAVTKTRTAKDSTRTEYTYTDGKGRTYDVYLNCKGKAYVGKTSAKTGKYYRQYMPAITDELNKENL